jgi:ABC-type sugar transport system ATPase subunit
VIRLEDVALRIGKFALAGVTIDVPSGGYGLIIGPTGSGKTTLLEAVAGHVPVSSGRITLDGRDVTRLAPEARGIGFVYQSYHLFPHHTVAENIGYGLREFPSDARRARVNELASLLGIAPLLERGIEGLSGENSSASRSRAPWHRDRASCSSTSRSPRWIRHSVGCCAASCRLMREREGVTTLHVTHDVDDALRLGDVWRCSPTGGVAQSGPPDHVFRFPNSPFVAHFLGSGSVLKGTIERTGSSEDGGSPPDS